MKKIYWRPSRASRTVLVLIAVVALAGIATVEHYQRRRRQPHYRDKLAAARLALKALQVLKTERIRRRLPIDSETDPMASGLIGMPMTPVTSNSGLLLAKQTSVNPNFAAVMVQFLKRVGVEPGQVVAVGPSGSFPALAVATYAAIRQLRLHPIIISSAAGSQFGANLPTFLWLDMEAVLQRQGIFPFRSIAASLGGIEDRAFGLSKEGKQMLLDSIERNGLKLIKPKNMMEGIEERMRLFAEVAGDRPIRAYINIGGGTASVGTALGKHLFKPGLNRTAPRGATGVDSVMTRFLQDGVPVIHLSRIDVLAKRHGLPMAPTTMPAVGQGKIFYRDEYNHWLVLGALLTILACLYAFIRSDLGFRLYQLSRRQKGGTTHPQKMV